MEDMTKEEVHKIANTFWGRDSYNNEFFDVYGFWKKSREYLEQEVASLRKEISDWKNGGYTNLWKMRCEDRDETIERQRQILIQLREDIASLKESLDVRNEEYENLAFNFRMLQRKIGAVKSELDNF